MPGSNARKAGVRDGMTWAALDVSLVDPSYEAELKLTDETGTRRVKFWPRSEKTEVAPSCKATVSANGCRP